MLRDPTSRCQKRIEEREAVLEKKSSICRAVGCSVVGQCVMLASWLSQSACSSHEVHAADYYYRRGAYVAAINRAQLAIKDYRNAPAIEDALHVMMLLRTRNSISRNWPTIRSACWPAPSRTARTSPAMRGQVSKNRGGSSKPHTGRACGLIHRSRLKTKTPRLQSRGVFY